MVKFNCHYILPLCFCLLSLGASAQIADSCKVSRNILNHLEVGANVGTTGLGLNLAMPVTDFARVRLGVDYLPRTSVPMTFNLMSYAGTETDGDADTKFDRLAELMKDFTGMQVDRKVKMNAKGMMVDFKFMVDVFPIKNNKHFYATAGFYWGSSKVGHVENNVTEAPSLIGCMMYNQYYDFFMNYTYLDKPIYKDVYLDMEMGNTMRDKFDRYGRVGAHVGNFKDSGEPYMMEPDENGMVRADMYVNHFKPYLGVGYTTNITKDGRWSLSVDAGALFWGRPRILTHERHYYDVNKDSWGYGTISNPDPDGDGVADYILGDKIDLAKDIENISGKVGTYVDVAKSLHVYPVVNLRIALKLF